MANTDEGSGGSGGGGQTGSVSAEQRRNAKTIIQVGQQLGVSASGILIALMAAFTESNLRNVNYGDRDSLGLFQQRNAWGTRSQRLNPAEAARMFFTGGHGGQRGLLDIRGWESMDPGAAAQRVQVSAFPDRYNLWKDEAGDLLAQLGGGSTDSGMGDNSTGAGGGTGGTGSGPLGDHLPPTRNIPTGTPGTGPGQNPWVPIVNDLAGKPGQSRTQQQPEQNPLIDPLSSAMEKLLQTTPGGGNTGGGGYAAVVNSPSTPSLNAGSGPVAGAAGDAPAALAQKATFEKMLDNFGSAPDAGTTGLRSAVINNAKKALGVPYVYGGTDIAKGVDCSSLLQIAMQQAGIKIPRLAHFQALAGEHTRVTNRASGEKLMKPGDFIFWGQINAYGDGHIAMYLGNNQIIEAPRTGLTVRIRSLYDSDFNQRPTYAVNMDKFYGGVNA